MLFLNCKANARVKLAKSGHGPHLFRIIVFCVVLVNVLCYRLYAVLLLQSGSNMTGTDLCVNKPHCAAAVRPSESEATTSTLPPCTSMHFCARCSILSCNSAVSILRIDTAELHRVYDNMLQRAQTCTDVQGDHFQHLL